MKISANIILNVLAAVLIGCIMTSCLSLNGKRVKNGSVIQLIDINASGRSWNTDDVSVVYEADKDGSQLELSGTVSLTGKVSGFNSVDSFYLDVYFVNDQMEIVSRQRLKSAPRGREAETWKFRREMALSENVSAIAFGYTGTVREGSIDSASWDFWHTPY